ncbi:ATP-grasp domain-containing protein [Patescibacteria group bacterium]|nr:ATP-grasp domain-containing protein [Patescibacteria group bacterium]
MKRYVKKENIIVTNPYDTDRILIDVISFCHKKNIHLDAVASHFELNVTHASLLASALSLPGIPPAAARRSSANKFLMRYTCQSCGIQMPRFAMFQTDDQAFATLRNVGVPAVIKPVMFGHSYGVVKIEEQDSRRTILAKLRRARKQLDPRYHPLMRDYHRFNGYFLAEEYIDGPTVSVDGLIQNGRIMICGLAEFVTSDRTFTQESAYFPGRVSRGARDRCFEYTKRIIRVLGFDHCGFHCEMKLTKRGPVLLEVAARLPGGKMTVGYQTAYGVDMMDLYIDICLGKYVDYSFREHRKVAYHNSIFTSNWGIVTGMKGLDTLARNKYFTLFWKANPGDLMLPEDGIPESVLYYQLHAPTYDTLKEHQQAFNATYQFAIQKTPGALIKRLHYLFRHRV